MASTQNHMFIAATLMLIFLSLDFTAAQIGISYGRNGAGLPEPARVVEIFKQYGIKRMRIYDPYPPTLRALSGTGIELTLGVPNDNLQRLSDRGAAANWVRDNIQNYPNVNFKHIVAGNEISPRRNPQFVQYVVPAMRSIHDALAAAGLGRIAVSTAIETDLIDPNTNYPPSKAEFRQELKPYVRSVLQFLVDTNGPLFVNIYPYFAYKYGGGSVPLAYALLRPDGAQNTPDGRYDNLYYALVDVMYAAMEKMESSLAMADRGSIKNVEVKGGESGWQTPPRPGGRADQRRLPVLPPANSGWNSPPRGEMTAVADQTGAESTENAQTYINNLIRVVKSGTPRRPNRPIETYIFAMFDESFQPEDAGRNFGIFQTNGQTKYPINFN